VKAPRRPDGLAAGLFRARQSFGRRQLVRMEVGPLELRRIGAQPRESVVQRACRSAAYYESC